MISGGVCAPKGFTAAGVHCGIRKNKTKKDLAVVLSEVPCSAAAVYTQNKVKGAPLTVTKRHIEDGIAQAVICNSGNANTCNAGGEQVAEEMCALVAETFGVRAGDVIVASTGVIGQPLDITPIKAAMPKVKQSITGDGNDAALAIMTTDTVIKQYAVEFTVGGRACRMGAMAKGSGMIHPNMATMLIFITTDVKISSGMLQKALSEDIVDTFNMISVDGDTSTNDMVSVMANGMAENEEITREGEDYSSFCKALNEITVHLCREIAKDGEGATKLLTCTVSGAKNKEAACVAAKSVICSSLVKSAMFGSDANWGRVLCALGYSGADIDVTQTRVLFSSAAGEVLVCEEGAGVAFSEELAKKVLSEDEIVIDVSFRQGEGCATAWGCDLTYDYVKINGDYRT
ncbi:MAG: bifunctional ornithine acetyltransferase/N-acetylglutamate synthase [Clostridia bacterium]|nr:bifunctional ornithine acetyltransferase/N-acetylglutamate synthase [Clostridia bacterium]